MIEALLKKHKKLLAILLDPDDYGNLQLLQQVCDLCTKTPQIVILIGGSGLKKPSAFSTFVKKVKSMCSNPIFLFPGDGAQLSKHANGVLLLSLISGRNAQYLIGEHVAHAQKLHKLSIPLLSMGYILINNNTQSSVAKVSNTKPIPPSKSSLIINTALAGVQLGLQHIYLEAGSGAKQTIAKPLVKKVKSCILQVPLWVGGGISKSDDAYQLWKNGADVVVVGNAVVKNPFLISNLTSTLATLK